MANNSLEKQIEILRQKLEEKEKILQLRQEKKDEELLKKLKPEIFQFKKIILKLEENEREKFLEFFKRNSLNRLRRFLEK